MTHGGIISDQDFEQAKLEMNEATEKAVIKDIYHIRRDKDFQEHVQMCKHWLENTPIEFKCNCSKGKAVHGPVSMDGAAKKHAH